ncbi:MAG: hypothetical protein JSV65_00355 [Armatimonadota bacterium]|nr:MAG: hypothetical protein JSV65_00355 [Armatimonadota bacterium]
MEREESADPVVDTLVAEVRYWMTRDLPVAVYRALREDEIDALRKRLQRVVRGEPPYGEVRLIHIIEGDDSS